MQEFDLLKFNPDIRRLAELEKVIYDKNWFASVDGDAELYYMYRGLKENDGIRYDITVMPAMKLGAEFNKTKGHIHGGAYQEIYTVLEGQAIYLFQKNNGDKVEDVVALKAQKGDVVVIPSGYGHITINPSKTEELKMANWVASACKSDYSGYEQLQGACYYYLESGWVKNPHYKNVPELRFEDPLKEIPQNLDFLKAN